VQLFAGLPSNIRSDGEVKRVQIRQVRRPEQLWPEVLEVVGQPLLCLVGRVAGGPVLLERPLLVCTIVGINSRLNNGPQELDVGINIDLAPFGAKTAKSWVNKVGIVRKRMIGNKKAGDREEKIST
jgi:hypothetical protein